MKNIIVDTFAQNVLLVGVHDSMALAHNQTQQILVFYMMVVIVITASTASKDQTDS